MIDSGEWLEWRRAMDEKISGSFPGLEMVAGWFNCRQKEDELFA